MIETTPSIRKKAISTSVSEKGPGQRRAQQHRTPTTMPSTADNSDHQKPRRLAHPETCDQPDNAAHQKQPSKKDRHRQCGDRRQDNGRRTQYEEHDAFDQKEYPMLM